MTAHQWLALAALAAVALAATIAILLDHADAWLDRRDGGLS
mgnify:CR=1 FL=1